LLLREAASLLQAGKLDEAEPLLRRAIAAAPSNADAHNLLGTILDQHGQTKAAEREYLAALRLNSRATSARANLGVRVDRGDVRAGSVVKVEGLGTRFSGLYYVISTVHSYSQAKGYRTKFSFRRNAA